MVRLFHPVFLLFPFILFSCDEENPERQAALDSLRGKPVQKFIEVIPWLGIYQDTLPCSDCSGVLTRLELKSDSSFKKSVTFLGKGDPMQNTFSTIGIWSIDAGSKQVTLNSDQEKQQICFQIVGDTLLRICDSKEMTTAASRYSLRKL